MTALYRASKSAQLADWRSRDRGPSFERDRGRIKYRMSEILAWDQEQTETPSTT